MSESHRSKKIASLIGQKRKEIDSIDKKIIDLLAKRFLITGSIQKTKAAKKIPILQKKREVLLMKKNLAAAKKKKLPAGLVKRLFKAVFYYSKKNGIIKR